MAKAKFVGGPVLKRSTTPRDNDICVQTEANITIGLTQAQNPGKFILYSIS
jgi:hypothetical protein